MYNIIVKDKRDDFESEIFSKAKRAGENGMFIDEDGEEMKFMWSKGEEIGAVEYFIAWEQHIE